MALFFKGVAIGTYHYAADLRLTGLQAARPAAAASELAMVRHIARGSIRSPFISLTRSYAIAADYALNASKGVPSPTRPAYVYEIEAPDVLPPTVAVYDPVRTISAKYNDPLSLHTYLHDGGPDLLLGVVDPDGHGAVRLAPCAQPPGFGAAGPPLVTEPLIAMVNALRDAEALAVGAIPPAWVTHRHNVY